MGKHAHTGDAHTRVFGFYMGDLKPSDNMIDKLTEEKIKDAARIHDVCSDFIDDIRKAGVEYTCRCPFHDDKHLGNFKISPKKNLAKCFSCGWSGDPFKFLMEYGSGMTYKEALMYCAKKYSIPCEDAQSFDYTPPPPRPAPPPLPTLELPQKMADGRMIAYSLQPSIDILVNWLRSLNFDSIERRRLEETIQAYKLGHAVNGMTIYWQIDEKQKVRTGKMMRYKNDGHRDRESKYGFDWIHSALIRRGPNKYYDPDKQECRPCFFGLHLLNAYKVKNVDQAVCIVESEKTAIIMATLWGNNTNQVWMACGGLENLSREKLKPIIEQHRRIILYPDRDGISKWRQKAEQLHYDRLIVIDKPVTEWWKPEDGPKADIADVLLRYVRDRKPFHDISEVKAAMPAASDMIDKLNLEIENDNERE